MVRLHFVVEGQTEETFVRDVLTEHLAAYQVYADALCLTTGRKQGRAHKGGLMKYDHLRQDLMRWIREDRSPEAWFTTMIDLYRLPADFPGRGESSSIVDPLQRVPSIEKQLETDIEHHQFIPHIQLHEFEAVLFCDLQVLAGRYPTSEKSIRQLEQACNQFPSPEHIDEAITPPPPSAFAKQFLFMPKQ